MTLVGLAVEYEKYRENSKLQIDELKREIENVIRIFQEFSIEKIFHHLIHKK